MWFQQIHQFAAFVAVYPFFAFSLSDVESSSSASSAVFKSSSVSSHDQMTGVAHRKDGMRPNPVFWRYYLTPHNKGLLLLRCLHQIPFFNLVWLSSYSVLNVLYRIHFFYRQNLLRASIKIFKKARF